MSPTDTLTNVLTHDFFLPSANEGAQHDQSKEKHWEVMISLYLLSTDGQDV